MTGLPHFAAKIKFVQCPKKLASCNARERQREEREREKKIIYFDMEENLQKNPQNFGLIPVYVKIKKLLIKNCI